MLEILNVFQGSIAEELEIASGDFLLSINDQPVRDLLDYLILARGEELCLEIRKADGEVWELELEKDAEEPLGIDVAHPDPDECGNNCIFCFVHQLPRGMRRTLYVKDEDYRFSFLYGSYVTLTNVDEADIERIIDQRLSPLYVSVHATDEAVRRRLIGRSGPPIFELLQRLAAANIQIHSQIVVCPGVNDGEILARTIEDLHGLHPQVQSLAVVPVGLTGHREGLPELRVPTADEARALIESVHGYQERYLKDCGTRFVFAADEYYLKAGVDFPAVDSYENFSQIENGVGLIALFRDEAAYVVEEAGPLDVEVSTVTGESAGAEISAFVSCLAEKTGARIHLHVIENRLFGGAVTVTGLISGRDIIDQLEGRALGSQLLIPDVMLKEGEDIFLDDLTLGDVEKALGVRVRKVDTSPWGLLDAMEEA